jgi:hypothetical protein
MAAAAHTIPFRYSEEALAHFSNDPVPGAVLDDLSDAMALVRVAIAALYEQLDVPGLGDNETLAGINRSLFLVDKMLCRVNDHCIDLNSEAAIRFKKALHG